MHFYFRLHELFQSVNMDLDDEVYTYLLDTKAPMKNYSLYEVYKIHDEGAPIINQLGGWSHDSYLLDFDDMNKNLRRHDLRVSILDSSYNVRHLTTKTFLSIRDSH